MKIAKEFKWEMGHRLSFHEGLCKNIHGHSYKATIEIEGEVDSNGIVLDYYKLGHIVDSLISKLDHSFIVQKDDKIVLDFLKNNSFKHHIISKQTTAENICEFMIKELSDTLNVYENLKLITIKLNETQDSYAEMSMNLNNKKIS
ncbi:MAG: 6-carboxytetrahydropterin synthase [Candidatus Kapabacteria bacterium]|nr:6-carboxytetrahydropterin synthase [Candidatus Kapabacteria bacterium]